jgi:hypothetical protein
VLLAVSGSGGLAACTVTTFVMVPFLVGFTLMVMVTVSPRARVPKVQVTTRFWGLSKQAPFVVDTDPNPAFLGS